MIMIFIEIIVVRVVLLTGTVKDIASYVVDIENISWNINLLLWSVYASRRLALDTISYPYSILSL